MGWGCHFFSVSAIHKNRTYIHSDHGYGSHLRCKCERGLRLKYDTGNKGTREYSQLPEQLTAGSLWICPWTSQQTQVRPYHCHSTETTFKTCCSLYVQEKIKNKTKKSSWKHCDRWTGRMRKKRQRETKRGVLLALRPVSGVSWLLCLASRLVSGEKEESLSAWFSDKCWVFGLKGERNSKCTK